MTKYKKFFQKFTGTTVVDWESRVGLRFGRLITTGKTVIKKDGRANVSALICLCDCGKETTATFPALTRGTKSSCGCLRLETSKTAPLTHGKSNSITYTSWRAMVSRCNNPNDKSYPYYGGRGIKVDKKWSDFSSFLEDMGDRPSKDYTLDRIDSNGNYCKDNCQWATRSQQSNNTRDSRLLEYKGETKTLKDWSILYNIKYHLLWDRVCGLGWDMEHALTIPPKLGNSPEIRGKARKKSDMPRKYSSRSKLFSYDGKTMCVAEWARHLGVSYEALRGRIRLGWDISKAIETPFV